MNEKKNGGKGLDTMCGASKTLSAMNNLDISFFIRLKWMWLSVWPQNDMIAECRRKEIFVSIRRAAIRQMSELKIYLSCVHHTPTRI